MIPNLGTNRDVQQLANLQLLARQVVEGFVTGLHQSPFHGFSVEFAEHRLYNSGESVKNVDWKLLARTDKLFVKQYKEETNLRSYLLLDTSSSMNFPEKGTNKLQFSIYAIASLMYLFKKQRDAFGLALFSDKVDWLSRARSTSTHMHYLFAELEKVFQHPKKRSTTNIAAVLHHIAEDVHKRSLIILFSDMLENGIDNQKSDELFAAIQHLKHNKHEIIIFNVTDREKEVEFNFANRPHHFVDLETGEELKVHPSDIKASYLKSLNSWRQKLIMKSAQFKVELIDADISLGFDHILKTYLVKRNKMS